MRTPLLAFAAAAVLAACVTTGKPKPSKCDKLFRSLVKAQRKLDRVCETAADCEVKTYDHPCLFNEEVVAKTANPKPVRDLVAKLTAQCPKLLKEDVCYDDSICDEPKKPVVKLQCIKGRCEGKVTDCK